MTTKKAKKIYSTDIEAMQAAISEAEGRATARTLAAKDANDTLETVVDKVLREMPKKYLKGCKATVHASNERLPKAYKHPADATQARFEHDGKGWVLVGVSRERLAQKSVRYGVELTLTDDAKQYILNQCVFV